jgi:hypothetical protein
MTYLHDREAVAMIDNNYENRIGLLVPHMESIGEWYFSRMDQLTLWRKVLAKKRITTEAEAETARIAMEAEAARIATEAEAARIAAEAEAARIAAEADATRIAAEADATRIAAEADATRIPVEAEAARRPAAPSASAHRPVQQSLECKQVERKRYEFWMNVFVKYCIIYLQGKTANKSPPPQALPAHIAKLLGNVMRFYCENYPPNTQGTKGYTDPRTGDPTAHTNKIIYDAIYASLPDECKLTFAQMFCNFDDLLPFKAPLNVNGKRFDFKKHVLNLLTDTECAEWRRVTINHLKWKYIDAINSGVQ